jgi:molybdopterin/thiamine biosynthesis adenylyltransferase
LKNEISAEIKTCSIPKKFPDGNSYQSLSVENVANLAKKLALKGSQIEIKALEQGIIPERYARNFKAFNPENQIILLKSQVSVIGLGGLGGAVSEILARIGIGTLNLIDGDTFEDSNLNRQFLSTQSLLAASKAEAAFNRVNQVNSSVTARKYAEFLDEKNATELIEGSNVVVDCLDNLKTRFILQNATQRLNIPLVSAAIAGTTGQVTVVFPEDQGLSMVYGEPESLPPKGAEAALGTLPHCVTTTAALECSEVVKILLKNGSLLRNRLLIIDLMDNTFEVLQLQ